MTTQKQNRDIKTAELQEQYDVICEYGEARLNSDAFYYYDEINHKFDDVYWSILMPVWKKLQDELTLLHNTVRENANAAGDWLITISSNISSVDLENSHILIHKAIEWLKKKQ